VVAVNPEDQRPAGRQPAGEPASEQTDEPPSGED